MKFLVVMKLKKHCLLILALVLVNTISAQKSPFFLKGEDPKPEGTKWKLIKPMSDEFKKKKIDDEKWQISGQGWIGRAPGLFQAENIKVAKGKLQITTRKLPKPVIKKGKTFTHGGGYVGSKSGMTYGYYECRMKANKTFMSSTFWLINNRRNVKECDRRTTELDIQECFGQITTDKGFTKNFDAQMNSNTHSRDIPEDCDFKTGRIPAKSKMGGKVYDDYHVYAVWWKSKDELLFFLDGEFQSKVKPVADFNLEMHLRMVVETYNWNPVPADGGMQGSVEERTTFYDWVRSWQLIDK